MRLYMILIPFLSFVKGFRPLGGTYLHGRTQSTCARASTSSTQTSSLPKVFFVLGGPGAGKGTQCAKLAETYAMTHLSAGELLREARLSGSSKILQYKHMNAIHSFRHLLNTDSTQGAMIEDLLRNGKIVPSEITVNLIAAAIQKSKASRILIDGFPRNLENLNTWNSLMSVSVLLLLQVIPFESTVKVSCSGPIASGVLYLHRVS
jgi:adenylate kinase family enzyme